MNFKKHYTRYKRFTHCMLIFYSCLHSLPSQSTYSIDTFYPVHSLDDFIEIVEDPQKNLTIDQVRNDSTLQFRSLKTSELKFQHEHVIAPKVDVHPVYWGKVSVKTNGDLNEWILQSEDRLFYAGAWGRGNGRLDLYAYQNGHLLFHKQSGTNIKSNLKEFPKNWNLHKFKLDIPIKEEIELYFRIEENQAVVYPFFNITVRKEGFTDYHPYQNTTISLQHFIAGAAFFLLVYNFLVFLFTRERIYWHYCIWLLVIVINFVLVDETLSMYFADNLTSMRFTIWLLTSNTLLFAFWYFGQTFIQSKIKYPRLHRIINIYLAIWIVETLIAGFLAYNKIDVTFGNVFINMKTKSFILMFGLGLCIYIATLKDNFARYFGIGAGIGIAFFILGTFWALGLIKLNFIPFNIGIHFLFVAFSFGLAFRQQQKSIENARKEAEAERIKDLDEVKNKFFSNVSHEFRTPLSLILGPLSKIEKQNPNGQDELNIKRKSFNVLHKNAKRLQVLVDQLLDLAKLESTQMKLSLEKADLSSFLNVITSSFDSMIEQKNISYNVSIDPSPENTYFDKDKLEKIVSNLISNAIKYTPEHGLVSVYCSFKNGYLIAEISDTGKGISATEIKKIFERFYRAEGSEEKGTGIGLALVKELVDLHQGQINVSSNLGKGTSFKVRIPYRLDLLPEDVTILEENIPIAQNRAKTPLANRMEEEATGVVKDKSPIVLVVEDNEDLRIFIKEMLEEDYEVITASDGQQGVNRAIDIIPDVILSDVMMPRKDGYSLCNELKSNPKTSHIPIIMLTAKAGEKNKMDGLLQGADAYLTKPFNEDELLIRIKNLLANREAIWAQFKSKDTLLVQNLSLKSADDNFLNEVMGIIKRNLDDEHFSMDDIARQVGFSRSQLHRKLKAIINKSPNQLIIETRLKEARRMLENKTGTVSEVAYSVGYTNLPYFTKSFKKQFGSLPSRIAEEA